MLERFKPKAGDSERVTVDSLHEVVTAIFEKMGVSSSKLVVDYSVLNFTINLAP